MNKKRDLGFWAKEPQKYATLENENRKTILFPVISKLISKSECNSILDYGGGDGGFLEQIGFQCEKHLYDPSEGMIDFARTNRRNINSFYTDDSNLEPSYFDVITQIHVVTVIKGDSELKRIFLKIHQCLKRDGEFIIGMTHPAFKNNYFSTFHTDFSTGKLEFNYLSSGLTYNVHLKSEAPGEYLSFECYHRPISVIFNFLLEAGFYINQVLEVEDKNFEIPAEKFLFPPFLVIKCKK